MKQNTTGRQDDGKATSETYANRHNTLCMS